MHYAVITVAKLIYILHSTGMAFTWY